MRTFKFLNKKIVFVIIVALFSINTKATTYYVSNTGNDDNDGLTPENAIQTIAEVNNLSIKPGDSILFEAGGIWRDNLVIPGGEDEKLVVISRYGQGPNPKILGSEMAENWTATGTNNVWVSSTLLPNRSAGGESGRIFFIDENDSASWGEYNSYNASFSNLTQEYDYTIDGTTYYVFSPSDPDTRYSSVEVSQRNDCISAFNSEENHHIEINGIDLKYAMNYGYNPGYPMEPGSEQIVFRNCTIAYIGYKGSARAYGIELVASNSLVENCSFSDCGRRALSMNVYDVSDASFNRTLENVIIRNNTFKRGWHTTSLDLAGNKEMISDTIRNIYFYNNYVDDSDIDEIGSSEQSNGIFLYNTGGSFVDNIYIVGNIVHASPNYNLLIDGCENVIIWNNTFAGSNPNAWDSPYGLIGPNGTYRVDYRNNIQYDDLPASSGFHMYGIGIWDEATVYSNRDNNLYYLTDPGNGSIDKAFTVIGTDWYSMDEWNLYRSDYPEYDANSPVPSDPLFTDYNNDIFTLTEQSPAAKSGQVIDYLVVKDLFGNVDTVNKNDMAGNPFSRTEPSIGAYQYVTGDVTEAEILTFTLAEQTGPATIDSEGSTINIEVAFGTNLNSLTPSITVSQGATIDPGSEVARNFSNTVSYTVTAKDGTTKKTWNVTVTVSDLLSNETDITSFSLPMQTGQATINSTTHKISVTVPFGTDVSSLTPTIVVSAGATIDPLSGVINNFQNPVNYTVTAQNGTTQQVWEITVIIEPENTNHAPVIEVLYDENMYKKMPFTLDASPCQDPDNDPLTYQWTIPNGILTSSTTDSIISIMPAANAQNGTFTIGLSISDGIEIVDKNIFINVNEYNSNAQELSISTVTASNSESPNVPDNIIDNNLDTRWSSEGDAQWIQFDLNKVSFLSYIELAFHEGDTRQSYFDVQASVDNTNWNTLLRNQSSCGYSSDNQIYEIASDHTSTAYSYIRVIGNGNSINNWNSYTEFKVYGYNTVGIENINFENNKKDIKIYPNPTFGHVKIETNGNSTIKIFDQTGRKVHEQYYTEKLISLTCDYKRGIYIVQVIDNDNIEYKAKLIIF